MSKVIKVYELAQLIQVNVMPILMQNNDVLVSFIQQSKPNVTKMNALKSASELGLDGLEKPLKWLQLVTEHENEKTNILLIENFLKLTEQEQMKFYELLKHRKVAQQNLPKNCCIVIEGNSLEKNKISPIIFSLIFCVE
ncbi:MAG: hypothetical protein CVV59_01020 [Tenericutes bacterium HGW-Tenericutes-4]|nr:MAG: hypothetical protein CVV59_01020 [Tenericutes bacterium HGW-Tenericutes-4]